jgi:hypothetical protein
MSDANKLVEDHNALIERMVADALSRKPAAPALYEVATIYSGNEVTVYLARSQEAEIDDADAVAHVRIVSDHAPGYYTAAAELEDICGDGEGVEAWLASNEDRIVQMHGMGTL